MLIFSSSELETARISNYNPVISPHPAPPLRTALTLDEDHDGVPGGPALGGEAGAGVSPCVFSLQTGEDELAPRHTEGAVRQGPSFSPPGEAGCWLSSSPADQSQL